ncbi:MAG: hypothetical protein J0L51_03335 [Rhizobiales bacterium]|nr:hypothetical protein [Hyphomicrobiales bacterium]
MKEIELVRRIVDFAFIIKAQLHSDDTALLRSILNILIMEAEDVIEELDLNDKTHPGDNSEQRWG